MKNIIFLMLITILFSSCVRNSEQLKIDENKAKVLKDKEIEDKKYNELINRVNNLLPLIQSSNLTLINDSYINKNFGLYEIFVDDENENITLKYEIKIEEIDDYIASNIILFDEIKFNCDSENDSLYGWEKDGVFLVKNFENLSDKLSIAEDRKNILKNSYKLIITNNIVLYLSYIENSWYITLIDKVTTDCSIKDIEKK